MGTDGWSTFPARATCMSTRRLPRLDSRAGVGREGIEAVAKLGDFAPILVPGQPWQKVRPLGNRLRHEYDAIRERIGCGTFCKPICPLCAVLVRMHCAG